MPRYDCIVLGVGGMGSAALFHLARRGVKVLGLERFSIPHDQGSSHGITRIIRLAYHEHPSYVPLLRRSFELWRELETLAGERLLVVTGSIDASLPNEHVFAGSKKSCLEHGLAHEVLSSKDLSRRFPGYRLPKDFKAVFQPDGGFLLAERCVVAHVNAALALGAEVRAQERVLDWAPKGRGYELRTDRGRYETERLVIAAGPWAGKLAPELANFAVPERQVLAWFQPLRPERYTPAAFPVFNMRVKEGAFYGFPIYGIPGFKLGRYHHLEQTADPDDMDREPHPEDEAVLRDCTEKYFPDAAGNTMTLKACLFTNSPDEHFILDTLPKHPRVAVGAGFTGHGFKFCSVIGEVLADLAMDAGSRHDLELFKLNRFAKGKVKIRRPKA